MTRRQYRRRHRSDANATDIIEALRKMGVFVVVTGRPTDILVGITPFWFPGEIKVEDAEYTDDQEIFLKDCETYSLPVLTFRSVEHAAEVVNAIRSLPISCKPVAA